MIPLVVAFAMPMALAATAGANPLLSGYGGPGQGEQAVLGAAVLNTPRGGGGGSGSSGGGSAEPSAAALALPRGAGNAPSAPPGKSRHARRPTGTGTGGAANGQAGAASKAALPSGGLAANAAATTSAGGALGLSGGDLAYLLLALAALGLAGGLTRQLARKPR
ncbi:MAG: hypothetical protein ACYDC2_00205 [Solirubrobacteraceae bacterium]